MFDFSIIAALAIFVLLLLAILVVGPRVLAAKRKTFCVTAEDDKLFQTVQTELTLEGIWYSRGSAPAGGEAGKSSKEIWIDQKDVERVENFLSGKYELMTTEFAIMVEGLLEDAAPETSV